MTTLPCVAGLLLLLALSACSTGGPPWPAGNPPTTSDRRSERETMVERQIQARGVRDPAVLQAMRTVPRHWFVPADMASHAYDDNPLPIGEDQTISQPYIVALMTEALALRPGDKVLEVGTGSGYQAAVLSALTPRIFTIEIVPELAAAAQRTFEEHGYTATPERQGITARQGDGYAGWPEEAPFDAIIVTAAPPQVPPPLLAQLAVGGRLCIPVGDNHHDQLLQVITKAADGSTSQRTLSCVRFVPMTGAAPQR